MRYALAALLVLVTVGASGQQSPLPPPSSDQAWCTGTCPFSCKFRDAKTGEWSKPEIFECNEKSSEGTVWIQSPGESYMRACGHQKWCFSFNGGPEISADELADRAKMLERIEKLEKRVAELEAWKKNLHFAAQGEWPIETPILVCRRNAANTLDICSDFTERPVKP